MHIVGWFWNVIYFRLASNIDAIANSNIYTFLAWPNALEVVNAVTRPFFVEALRLWGLWIGWVFYMRVYAYSKQAMSFQENVSKSRSQSRNHQKKKRKKTVTISGLYVSSDALAENTIPLQSSLFSNRRQPAHSSFHLTAILTDRETRGRDLRAA